MDVKEMLKLIYGDSEEKNASSGLGEECNRPTKREGLPLESVLKRKLPKNEVIAQVRERHKETRSPTYWLEYATAPINITKSFVTWPTGKRGDRGFLLDEKAEGLLPAAFKAEFRALKEKHGSRLVYVNGGVVGLPMEFYRLEKASIKKDCVEVGLFG